MCNLNVMDAKCGGVEYLELVANPTRNGTDISQTHVINNVYSFSISLHWRMQ